MHVAVVIVGYRNTDDLVRCVGALGRSIYADFEVVIVENGGREAFERDVLALPVALSGGQPVLLIEASRNLGFAGGVNLGIERASDADAWWVLNPDAVASTQAMGELVERLEVGDCEAVGGVLHFADGTIQSVGGTWQSWIARAVSIGSGLPLSTVFEQSVVEAKLDYIVGASMLIHRRFRDATGLMREDYFLYAEEIEWFLRGAAAGMRLGFAPKAHILHHQGTTTGWAGGLRTRPKMPVYLDERNRILVTRDRFPKRVFVVEIGSLLLMIARFARKRAWRQIGYGLQGWFAAIRGERGVPGWMKIQR
jgi:N-acetylglucosaminyl-diphospho-decaprenol L-rhamnosyltransferase